MSYYAVNGLGGDDCTNVPYTDNRGAQGNGGICPVEGCGDVKALQQALNDLGMSPVPLVIDGLLGENTYNAVATAAATYNMPHTYGILDQPTCKMVGDAWAAKLYGQAYPPPPVDAGGNAPVRGTRIAVTTQRAAVSKAIMPLMQRVKAGAMATREGSVPGGSTMDKVSGWWNDLPMYGKVGVVGGGVAAVGLIAYLLTRPKTDISVQTMTPNKRGPSESGDYNENFGIWILPAGKRLTKKQQRAARRDKDVVLHWASKKTSRSKSKWNRLTPPKKYRKLGFTRREHYAWPYGYHYPIGDAKHTRAAARYFGQHKRRYSPLVRQLIAARIENAKKYFGIGEYRGKVVAHRGKHAFAIRKQKISRRKAFRGRKAA